MAMTLMTDNVCVLETKTNRDRRHHMAATLQLLVGTSSWLQQAADAQMLITIIIGPTVCLDIWKP